LSCSPHLFSHFRAAGGGNRNRGAQGKMRAKLATVCPSLGTAPPPGFFSYSAPRQQSLPCRANTHFFTPSPSPRCQAHFSRCPKQYFAPPPRIGRRTLASISRKKAAAPSALPTKTMLCVFVTCEAHRGWFWCLVLKGRGARKSSSPHAHTTANNCHECKQATARLPLAFFSYKNVQRSPINYITIRSIQY
jgi:hypothetical protein